MPDFEAYKSETLSESYDDSHIVLMAIDPHCLYAYWEISPSRKENFVAGFGYPLWEKSVPVLKVTNLTLHQSFYVKINDTEKHWFIPVSDANCLYSAEIGRKVSDQFFVNLASSASTASPANCASTDKTAYFADYRDLRKGQLRPEDKVVLEEMLRKTTGHVEIGVSSAQAYGTKLEAQSGISSESFMKG